MKCTEDIEQNMSPPTRVVWIEIFFIRDCNCVCVSPPTRWCGLKYIITHYIIAIGLVTTHTGGVD